MKRTALFLLAFVIFTIAACRPISRGPNPYQPPSPLAMLSPLYARGEAPAISLPGGLVAPDDYRAGTIPTTLPTMRYRLFAPIMAHQKRYDCGVVPMAAELLRLMIEDAEQMRRNPLCDNAMVAIAQNRANDMTSNRYFNHVDLSGWNANHWVKVANCLPPHYPENGNTTESITLNYFEPETAWRALVRSPGHVAHVLGLHPFFAEQDAIGVGYSSNEWGTVFVILSVPRCN